MPTEEPRILFQLTMTVAPEVLKKIGEDESPILDALDGLTKKLEVLEGIGMKIAQKMYSEQA